MSILIIFQNKDPKPWQAAIQSALPDVTVEVYPDFSEKNNVDFVVCWKPEKNILQQFPKLQAIQSVGASVDHVVHTQGNLENVQLSRIVDENLTRDMWEFLLAAVLAWMKNFSQYANQQGQTIWKQTLYRTIKQTKIAILGLGAIGRFVASSFASIGFAVNGWSQSKKDIEGVKCFDKNELEACLQGADVLINLLPFTPETDSILNKRVLMHLNKGAYLINVGRGEHLDEANLVELLDDKQLSAALLDVFRQEPLPESHPFWNHPSIQITPHVASLTNIDSAITQVVENYKRLKANKALLHLVSWQKGY